MHKHNSKNCVLVAIILAIGAILPMTVFASPDAIEYCKDKDMIARAARIRALIAPMWKDPKDAYEIVILESDDINVFNLNKTMFITTGLVRLCQKDDEIAGLAIHEWYSSYIAAWERILDSPDTAYRIKLKNLKGSTDTLKIIKCKDGSELTADIYAVKILGMLGLDYKSYGALLERLRDSPNQEKLTFAKWNPPFNERINSVQRMSGIIVANESLSAKAKALPAKQFSDAINGTPIAKYGFSCVDKQAGLYVFYNSSDKAITEKKKITLPANVTKAVFYVHAVDMPKDCKLFSAAIKVQHLEISDQINEFGVAIEIPLAYLPEISEVSLTDKYFDKKMREKKIETEFVLCFKSKITDVSPSDFQALREPKIYNPYAPDKSAAKQ